MACSWMAKGVQSAQTNERCEIAEGIFRESRAINVCSFLKERKKKDLHVLKMINKYISSSSSLKKIK